MSAQRIAIRYAKSLLDLAIENQVLEQTVKDIEVLSQSLKSRDLYLLTKSPIIKGGIKRKIFKKIFDGKVSKMTSTFFDIIIRKGREEIFPEIATSFEKLYRGYKQISSVVLTTAIPLDDKTVNDIKKKLHESGMIKKNLDLQVVVDSKIIGGFVIEFDDKQYDASILHKLHELKKQFSKN